MSSRTRWFLAVSSIIVASLLLWTCNASSPAEHDDDREDADSSDGELDPDTAETTAPDLDTGGGGDGGDVDGVVETDTSVADDTRPSDADAAPDVPETGWWSDLENTCAPPGSLQGREVQRTGTPPVPNGTAPTLVWELRELCAGLGLEDPILESPDYEASPLALGPIELDGQVHEAVFTTLEVSTLISPWGYIEAIAVIDAHTGQPLMCWPLPYDGFVVPTEPIFLPDEGRVLLSAGKPHPDPDAESLLASVELASGAHVSYRVPGPETSGAQFYFASNEVAIARFDQRHVAVSTHEEKIYWTLPVYGSRRFGAAADEIIGVINESIVAVDECGQGTTESLLDIGDDAYQLLQIQDAYAFNPVSESGGGWALWKRDGQRVATLDDCLDVVTLDDNHLACVRQHGTTVPELTTEIVTFDLNGRIVRTIEVETPWGPRPWLVAGADGSLVFSASIRDADGTLLGLRVHIVASDGSIESLDLLEPDEPYVSPLRDNRPVLSPDGMLVLSIWGHVYGIQTGVPGLAGGGYPRGYLGGNENRTYVQPPPAVP